MSSGDLETKDRFVRVLGRRANDLIEFEFAIGDPDLFVELIMPKRAFDEFCATNHVAFLGPRTGETAGSATGADDFTWTLRDATSQRLR